MAYLNEDGLETLVGKIKGQVIELTSAEYRQLPATKNTDNKLYFVNDEAYAYQIDDEPTSGSSGLVKSGGVYNWTSKIGSGTLTTTAQTIIPAVNEVNAKIGSTDISSIGDGSLTGAVSELNNGLTWKTLVSGQITGNGSYPLLNDLNGATEVLIQLYSDNKIRQSLIVSVAQLRASLVFPDFYFAGHRMYCQMDVTSSSILISNFNAPSQLSGASLLVQYH